MDNKTISFNSIENKIIQMIANEMPNKQIADELNYSQRNVEYYISNISKQLEVKTRVGIVVKSIKNNLIQI